MPTIPLENLYSGIQARFTVPINYEFVTADHSSCVPFNHQPLAPGNIQVFNVMMDTQYQQGIDFNVNYAAGEFCALSSGSIGDGQQVVAAYAYDPYLEATYCALIDFGRRVQSTKTITISIQTGVIEYELPADFLFNISMDCSMAIPSYNCESYCSKSFVAGKLIFASAPSTDGECTLCYSAAFMPTGEPPMVDLPLGAEWLIQMKARSVAMMNPGVLVAGSTMIDPALTSYSYAIGGEQFRRTWDSKQTPASLAMAYSQEYEMALLKHFLRPDTKKSKYKGRYPKVTPTYKEW